MSLPSISVDNEADQQRIVLFAEAFGFLGFGLLALIFGLIVYGVFFSQPVSIKLILLTASIIIVGMIASTEIASSLVNASKRKVREFISRAGALIAISNVMTVIILVGLMITMLGDKSETSIAIALISGAIAFAFGLRVVSYYVVLPKIQIKNAENA